VKRRVGCGGIEVDNLWISPLVAAVLLVVGYRLWLVGLNRYEGTGS
jgi:ABC-type uncharacterized transport system permease subunit